MNSWPHLLIGKIVYWFWEFKNNLLRSYLSLTSNGSRRNNCFTHNTGKNTEACRGKILFQALIGVIWIEHLNSDTLTPKCVGTALDGTGFPLPDILQGGPPSQPLLMTISCLLFSWRSVPYPSLLEREPNSLSLLSRSLLHPNCLQSPQI